MTSYIWKSELFWTEQAAGEEAAGVSRHDTNIFYLFILQKSTIAQQISAGRMSAFLFDPGL